MHIEPILIVLTSLEIALRFVEAIERFPEAREKWHSLLDHRKKH